MGRDDGRERGEHIASAGMCDDARDGARAARLPELADGVGGEFGDGAVEEVAQAAVAVLEAEFVALDREVERVESEAAQRVRARRGAPDARGGAVAEEAGADDDAGIVVEVKCRRAHFDRDARDGGAGLGGEQVAGGAKRGNRGAAAKTDEVLQENIGAEAEQLCDVAGEAGAKVTCAGSDEERVELRYVNACARQRGGEGAGGERGGFGAEG